MSKVRCAIYTRKSSEEGLDQEYNSLDAQYDACKAYIASQKHEGWSLNRERYDDGGISGGTMERPALRALLADVAAGKVDVIIIYKIDRLTRSLADFARIVELLEKHGASFVSVTQSFNTKTSMGRLMLHVLLSFAQFEREVGAERVRDKIAASKAKGMWMGGTIPLGYDVADKKLVINLAEADTVRVIFGAFVELKSVQGTLRWAQREGLRTKSRVRLDRQTGNKTFEYGSIRCLLGNRLYVGEIEHKGKIHQGQHDPIVDRSVFDEAQAIIATLGTDAVRGPKLVSGSLLQGLIVDRHGRTMGPVHTTRSGQRFRYYVTYPRTIREGDPSAYRLAAVGVETICCALLVANASNQVSSVEGQARARELAAVLTSSEHRQRRELIIERVRKVIIGDGTLTVALNDGTTLERSIERVRHGNDARLVIGERKPEGEGSADPQLIILLRDAYRARALALSKPNLSLDQLAIKFGRSTERYKRLIRLSYLSPKIIATIIESRQPAQLTNRFLQNLDGLPLGWANQNALLLA
ncbi:recombinase family protein [Sphingomonas sp.]|uniref:recombinase family protein n=1 Tax=Sphingomonas sp. TaxID=28214 RepID=UPI003751DC01